MSIYIPKRSLQFVQSVPETKDEKSVENTDSSDDKKTNILPGGNIRIVNEQINDSKKRLKEQINQYETICAKMGIKPDTSLLSKCKNDLNFYTPSGMDTESKLNFLKNMLENLNNDISHLSAEINNIVLEQLSKQKGLIQSKL